jgi:hypothetical protein
LRPTGGRAAWRVKSSYCWPKTKGERALRHQDMVAIGVLPVLIRFLDGEDF